MWGLGFILIAALAIVFYLALGSKAKSLLSSRLLDHQQTLARAQASNVASFFQVFGESIATLSDSSDITNSSTNTQATLEHFVAQWQGSDMVGGIVLTDQNGLVQFNANISGTQDTGASLADRDYFIWAKIRPKQESTSSVNPSSAN